MILNFDKLAKWPIFSSEKYVLRFLVALARCWSGELVAGAAQYPLSQTG
jgi:hypothetical protein